MRKVSIVLGTVFIMLNVQAVVDASLKKAYLKGADAKITYRVVDDEGMPVEGATAHIWFRTTCPKLVIDDWVVNTDSNGMFTAAHKTNDRLSCGIDKDGYYHTFDRVTFSDPRTYPLATDGKWQPYGNEKTIVLKRMRNPEKMVCLNKTKKHLIPSYDTWLAFDLERSQFVAPYGEGKYSDVLLRFTLNNPSRKDYHMKMEVSFTNMPYAGAYQIKKDDFSDFKSVYHADTNANYLQVFVYSFDRNPQKRPIVVELGEDECLVFRTRTKIDEKGHLISANYGVLYGQWQFVGPGGMKIPFLVFNPTPNDTNLEQKR
jgi:hypothetical protein